MTPQQAEDLVSRMCDVWGQAKMPAPAFLALLGSELGRYEYATARTALRALARTAKWFPTIAEVVEACDAVDAPEGVALEQWGIVCEAIRRVGVYGDMPKFVDPVTARCVSCLGWVYLCKSPNDAADRARFCELYGELQGRDRRERRAGLPRSLDRPLLGQASKDEGEDGGGQAA